MQEEWLWRQIALSETSPRSQRRADATGSDNDISMEEIGSNSNADDAADDVIGEMWHQEPMEQSFEEAAGDDESQAGYDVDQDTEDERQSIFDSDANLNAETADLPSDEEAIPNPIQPSLPPNPRSHNKANVELLEVTDEYGRRVYVQQYHVPTAGEPIRQATRQEMSRGEYPDVGKLSDREAFEIAQVLMELGMSAKYRNKYLRVKKALLIKGNQGVEIVELWMQNALEIIKRLLQNKRFGKFMQFKPIKKWTSPERTEQIRDDIFTADLAWELQGKILDEYGTVIPVIISSNKTKLTNFSGDKKAHPVYLTIGNLPKRLRRRTSKRANILLG
ncbi:hypothetical protein FRC07_011886, partial [Ceratobasidium sp. 392]